MQAHMGSGVSCAKKAKLSQNVPFFLSVFLSFAFLTAVQMHDKERVIPWRSCV